MRLIANLFLLHRFGRAFIWRKAVWSGFLFLS